MTLKASQKCLNTYALHVYYMTESMFMYTQAYIIENGPGEQIRQ